MTVKHVAVTGAAGQIAYSLLFNLANGNLFGPKQKICLHLLEIPEAINALKGVVMELNDCAFPLLTHIEIGSDPMVVFKDVEYAFLVGASPRKQGMERSDLLAKNAQIFSTQGRALNEVASRDVKVLVVGNPCNTNALICMSNAPNIPKRNFHAMTRLDQNRAASQLAEKAHVAIDDVSQVCIWGNHSTTQVPDYFNAKIKGKPALEVIKETPWFETLFIPRVQKRGAEVLAARGASSAASAAKAAVDAMRALVEPTREGDWFSTGVVAEGNPYGIDGNLIYSFPCRSKGDGNWEIVKGVPVGAELRKKMQASEKELQEERALVAELLTPTSNV